MKKRKTITGSIICLEVGKPAIIHNQDTDCELWTSIVQHCIHKPDGTVWFETLSTEYTLTPVETYGNATFAELFKEIRAELEHLEKEYHYRKFPRNERVNHYNQLTSVLLTMQSITAQEEL